MRIFDRTVATALPLVPRPLVRHFADRYMAGETLDQAVQTVQALNAERMMATVDVLGESIREPAEATQTVERYVEVLQTIQEKGLDANISVKLSALGVEIDRKLGAENAARLVREADSRGIFVRLDMEHSGLTDATLEIYRELRAAGHERVGVVIQAYLRRSLGDLRNLAPLRPNVRLVKGIYVEPPAIAYRDPQTVNRNFIDLVEELVGAGSYVAVATHDPLVVDESLRLFDRMRLDRAAYEFQMLLGVAEELRRQLVDHDHRMRVYVPFGDAWYSYSVRRLRENPSIAGYVARDVFRSISPL
ncbi:MAG TPA: proline dehydrogenase family protein [Gaiellales bacterium]|jgi:proline dehydrogenase|nr:proline dehydrogenase family protein [Gaiellales bacterium]